jgi:hypothetical protein
LTDSLFIYCSRVRYAKATTRSPEKPSLSTDEKKPPPKFLLTALTELATITIFYLSPLFFRYPFLQRACHFPDARAPNNSDR